jgi:hypothetical protein
LPEQLKHRNHQNDKKKEENKQSEEEKQDKMKKEKIPFEVVPPPEKTGTKCNGGHCPVISNRDKSNLRGLMVKNKLVPFNKKETIHSLTPQDLDWNDME